MRQVQVSHKLLEADQSPQGTSFMAKVGIIGEFSRMESFGQVVFTATMNKY